MLIAGVDMEQNPVYNKIGEEIKQEYYQQNFPNNGQRFVAWYLIANLLNI